MEITHSNNLFIEEPFEVTHYDNLFIEELVETNHRGDLFVEKPVQLNIRGLIIDNSIERKTNYSLSDQKLVEMGTNNY
jgi:hypothetical protein